MKKITKKTKRREELNNSETEVKDYKNLVFDDNINFESGRIKIFNKKKKVANKKNTRKNNANKNNADKKKNEVKERVDGGPGMVETYCRLYP